MLTLPGTCKYVEKVSYIWVEVRVQTHLLSNSHRKELPHAGTSRGAATDIEYLALAESCKSCAKER